MTTIVRRRNLGMSSVQGITNFSRTGIIWVRSDRVIPHDDMFIRWGCTCNLPDVGLLREGRAGHYRKPTIINSAKAIHLVADKLGFRRVLEEAELCPKTFFTYAAAVEDHSFPFIVRTRYHHQGRGLWLAKGIEALKYDCQKLGEGNYYINEFIDKVAEYRVFVVQGRAVCVAQKTPGDKDDVAWNVAKGGRFDNVKWNDWPLKAVKRSIEAFNLSGLDFGGVDVMVGPHDPMVDKYGNDSECYILEINSAPSLTSPYRQQCMAKAFDWIVENGKEHIPLVNERGGYRKFIHPAVCGGAQIVGDNNDE